MEYRFLTGTGAKISRLCLGTMIYGNQVAEADAIPIIHRALDLGINFIDTADVYNQGLTEEIVGKAIKDRRQNLVLTSKVFGQMGDDPKNQGLSRWHILRGVEDSLRRLQTDALDVLFYHGPDNNRPVEESLEAAAKLLADGKIMCYGLSNHAAWQVCRSMWLSERLGVTSPTLVQVPYNLITRAIEQELLPFCRDMKVGVTVYNPLAGGFLTGKHQAAQPPAEGTRFQMNQMYYERYWRGSNFDALAALRDVAQQAGKSPLQLALQWLAQQPTVDAIIIGASKLEQLEANVQAMDGTLDDDTLQACDAVWAKIKGESFQYNR